jgi:hypothetical protein
MEVAMKEIRIVVPSTKEELVKVGEETIFKGLIGLSKAFKIAAESLEAVKGRYGKYLSEKKEGVMKNV